MKKQDELKAGIFIAVGLSLFALIIFVMGSERQIFASQDEFLSTFKDVKGLSEGAPVRLGGITVGRVAKIGFSDNRTDPLIHVKFLINTKFLDRIRRDAMVMIETQGLLGDKFLNISPGKETELLPAGANMISSEPADLTDVLAKASVVVENTVEISKGFNEFVTSLKNDTLPNFTKASASIGNLATEIEKGDGLAHRLIYSKKDGDSIIQGLSDASKNIGTMVNDIKSGNGLLNALIYDPSGAATVKDLAQAARTLSETFSVITEITKEIKDGKGMLHHAIYEKSPEGLDSIITKLNETATNFKKASEALAQGSGTIGALLVDPQLYDNLVEVTDGAKRSYLLRQAIRSSLDK